MIGRDTEQDSDATPQGPAHVSDPSSGSADGGRAPATEARPDGNRLFLWVPKLGIGAWSFVGFVVATAIVVAALGAVSEIVLPLTFAAVLAVIFKPLVGTLQRHKLKPTLAAGLVVLGLLALMLVVFVATVRGVTEQTDEIGSSVDAAIDNAADELDVDRDSLDDARAATEAAAPMIGDGFVTHLVSGVDKLIGLASGVILGALIMYYLLKDGTRLRRSVVAGSTPRCATTSTASSAIPAGSFATTGEAVRSCLPSWRWSSAWPHCCSASRWSSRSSWSTSSAATSPTSAPSSAAGWP